MKDLTEIEISKAMERFHTNGYFFMEREFPLLRYSTVHTEEDSTNMYPFGRIDIIFRYKRKNYCGEIKGLRKGSKTDFLGAMKVIAYTEYYMWQQNVHDFYPTIIIPKSEFTEEYRLIAQRLAMDVFLIDNVDGRMEMTFITSDVPGWKGF